MPRVGLLECDHVDDRYRAIGGDYADMFERLLPDVDLVRYDVIAGTVPSTPDECDGWVATGSRHSVYEDFDWIRRTGSFVDRVRIAGVPFVGICFGHQLLAHFTGGRTAKADAWGVGAHALSTGERLLYMHQDQVVDLPPGSELVASTDHCANAVIRVGDSMLGIQAHPEFTGEYVEALLHAREERIGRDLVDAALASLDAPRDEDVAARWMTKILT